MDIFRHYDSKRLVGSMNALSTTVLGWEAPTYFSMYNGFPHLHLLGVVIPAYLLLVFSLQRYMRGSKQISPFVVQFAFWHNSFMAILSLFMFVDCIVKMLDAGAFGSFSSFFIFDGNLAEFGPVYDLFFWSKYLELIDTFILIFRHKRPDFLHLFHHSTTASLGFVSRFQPLCLGVWTNSLVHVLMYVHFARPIRALRPAITTLQIVQFLWVLAAYFYWFQFYSTLTWVDVAYQNACYGIYLAFFMEFFYTNYIDRTAKTTEGKKKA